MAIDRAKEARKKAKAKREARLAKSKGKKSDFLKGVGKGLEALGVGKDKEEWKKGEPERKEKRKAAREESAKRAEANKKKRKSVPVYKSKKRYYAEGGEVGYNWPSADARGRKE